MANERDKSTKKDIQATELMNALIRALQRDDNYNRFVGGRDTGGVSLLETGDGSARIVIDLSKAAG